MDCIRSCYETDIRPYIDSDQTVTIRWYFVPLSTPFLGRSSAFLSRNWAEKEPWPEGPGEVNGADRHWMNGQPPMPGCCAATFGIDAADGGYINFSPTTTNECRWPPIAIGGLMAGRGQLQSKAIAGRYYQGNLVGGGRLLSPVPAYGVYYVGHLAGGGGLVGVEGVQIGTSGHIAGGGGVSSGVVAGPYYVGHIAGGGGVSSGVVAGPYYVGQLAGGGGLAGGYSPPTNPLVYVGSCSVAGTYSYWVLTVSGISGSGCTSFNGTFHLHYSSGTSWPSLEEWPSTSQPYWVLSYSGTDWYLESFDGSGTLVAQYLIAGGSYNCQAANTFPFGISFSCSGWPSTLTVTPS